MNNDVTALSVTVHEGRSLAIGPVVLTNLLNDIIAHMWEEKSS